MSGYVTYEEQKEMGLIRESDPRFLPAKPQTPHHLSNTDQTLLSDAVGAAAEMTVRHPIGHLVRSDDTAVTQAKASLLYSVAYAVAAGLITAGICFIGYLYEGSGGDFYALLWLVSWGVCILVALAFNRRQGLWFSSSGIAHHEIESRERVAMHAIDRHVALIEARWKLGNEQ